MIVHQFIRNTSAADWPHNLISFKEKLEMFYQFFPKDMPDSDNTIIFFYFEIENPWKPNVKHNVSNN